VKEQMLERIVNEVIIELPLKESVYFANLDAGGATTLQRAFDLYIKSKINGYRSEEFNNIMSELWRQLRKTHRLRVVK